MPRVPRVSMLTGLEGSGMAKILWPWLKQLWHGFSTLMPWWIVLAIRPGPICSQSLMNSFCNNLTTLAILLWGCPNKSRKRNKNSAWCNEPRYCRGGDPTRHPLLSIKFFTAFPYLLVNKGFDNFCILLRTHPKNVVAVSSVNTAYFTRTLRHQFVEFNKKDVR